MRDLPLGAAGIEYVRSQLAAGKTLARLVSAQDLSAGEVSVSLPGHMDPGSVLRFDQGFLRSTDATVARTEVLRKVTAVLAERPHSCAIFEHRWASRADPFLAKIRDAGYFSFEDEVYFYVENEGNDLWQRVEAAKRRARSYGTAFVSSMSHRLRDRHQVTFADLEELASDVQLILVSVYDDETDLIWMPSSR